MSDDKGMFVITREDARKIKEYLDLMKRGLTFTKTNERKIKQYSKAISKILDTGEVYLDVKASELDDILTSKIFNKLQKHGKIILVVRKG